jgi:hypothetical protein
LHSLPNLFATTTAQAAFFSKLIADFDTDVTTKLSREEVGVLCDTIVRFNRLNASCAFAGVRRVTCAAKPSYVGDSI